MVATRKSIISATIATRAPTGYASLPTSITSAMVVYSGNSAKLVAAAAACRGSETIHRRWTEME